MRTEFFDQTGKLVLRQQSGKDGVEYVVLGPLGDETVLWTERPTGPPTGRSPLGGQTFLVLRKLIPPGSWNGQLDPERMNSPAGRELLRARRNSHARREL